MVWNPGPACRGTGGPDQEYSAVGILQGVNQPSLLPIAQGPRVDAVVFFYDFTRLDQDVVLKL